MTQVTLKIFIRNNVKFVYQDLNLMFVLLVYFLNGFLYQGVFLHVLIMDFSQILVQGNASLVLQLVKNVINLHLVYLVEINFIFIKINVGKNVLRLPILLKPQIFV